MNGRSAASGALGGKAAPPAQGVGGEVSRTLEAVRAAMAARYIVVRPLGQPGGRVVEAVQVGSGLRVALKVWPSPDPHRPEGAPGTGLFATLLARLRGIEHAHLSRVVAGGQEQGMRFLAMTLLDGAPWSEAAVSADILLPVCAAVHALHAAGLAHGRLAREHVLLARTPTDDLVPRLVGWRLDEAGRGLALLGGGRLAPGEHPSASGEANDVAVLRALAQDCLAGLSCSAAQAETLAGPLAVAHSAAQVASALLPLASARARLRWTDAFDRDRPPVGGGAIAACPGVRR